jgi:ribosomal protein S18 acetylase RimI-like enzyme
MEVSDLASAHSDEAAALFNRLTRGLPHSFPALPEEIAAAIEAPLAYAQHPVRVAVQHRGMLRGLALAALNTPDAAEETFRVAGPGCGSITGLFGDSPDVLEVLTRVVTERLREGGAGRLVAFDAGECLNQMPFFNAGFAACPEGLAGVGWALSRAGFTLTTRELNMTCDLRERSTWSLGGQRWAQASPLLSAGLTAGTVFRCPEKIEVAVSCGVRRVGSCIGHLIASRQRHRAAESHGYITWLGVDPDYQRQGIGRVLLRLMIEQMRELGVGRVLLTTGSQNWRAQPLYLSAGFVVEGTSVTFARDCAA